MCEASKARLIYFKFFNCPNAIILRIIVIIIIKSLNAKDKVSNSKYTWLMCFHS